MKNKKTKKFDMVAAGLVLIAGYILNQIGLENVSTYIFIIITLGIIILGIVDISKSQLSKRQKIYFYLMLICIAVALNIYILSRKIGLLSLSKHSMSIVLGGSVCCVLVLLMLYGVDHQVNG